MAAREPAKLAELKALLLAKYHEVRDEAPTWPVYIFNKAEQDAAHVERPDYVKNPAEWPEYIKARKRAEKQ